MHAYIRSVRTTVEIPEDLRIRLIEEAARLGERGYSGVVERALRAFFEQGGSARDRAEQIEALYGADPQAEAVRSTWRTGG